VIKGRVARSRVSDLLTSRAQPFDGGTLVAGSQSSAADISACQRRRLDTVTLPVESRVV
jgi:hypothetical protein